MGETVRRRKIATHPRNPWEKDRLVKELYLLGTYGLRNKRELWTILAKARDDKKQARKLLISTNHKEFITQGRALCNRLFRNGMLSSVDFNDDEDVRRCLREVLNFESTKYLDRRLQQLVVKAGIAKHVHHARRLITHKQIVIKGRIVDKPSMIVRSENDGHIEINPFSSIAGFKKGRYAKRIANQDPKEE